MSPDPERDAEQKDPKNRIEEPNPLFSMLGRRTYQALIEQRIADAEAAGLFRNLPGVGKPLALDDDSNVPEEDRAAFRLLKNAGFAPPWIELQKAIREDQAALNTWLQRVLGRWERCGPRERQRLRDEYQQRLRDLAKLIDTYNFSAPNAVPRLPGLRMQEELKKLSS
jgi:hypothetical protein